MATLCAQCGFDNPAGMKFCGNCGVRLVPVVESPAPVFPQTNQPTNTDTTTEQLGVMFGRDLLERFNRAGLDAAGQRRDVTVLFVDLTGYTALSEQYDNEVVFELIQSLVQRLTNDVYRYDGNVDKLTGDGLMALFGAPVALENNAERAIRSALDMFESLEQLNSEKRLALGVELRMRIGLHSGSVIVGGIGTNQVMNYTAIGDTVNLAHRLEEAAEPGSIFVSETVFRQTRPLFRFAAVPPLTLKGISQPVAAYRVIAPKAKPGSLRGIDGLHAPMVGRDQELATLKEAVQQLIETRNGQVVVVTGDAGMGKSRLTAELKAHITGSPVRIIEGHILTYRRSVSYWVFLDLLRNHLGLSPDTPEDEARNRLEQNARQLLGKSADDVLPYLEHLMSLPHSCQAYAEKVNFLDAVQLRQQVFLAVRELLLAEARRNPLMLVFEDLHWCDDASLELITFLIDSIDNAPILIYAITRPIEGLLLKKLVERAQKLTGSRCHVIRLQSLNLEQSAHLLEKLLTTSELPVDLREQVLQRAAGVPFYLEEILRMLIDDGVLRQRKDTWQAVPGIRAADLKVPETLQGLILARFDRLNQIQRRILQVSSVIGREVDLTVLQHVMQPISLGELAQVMEELVRREFVTPREVPAQSYIFRHVLVSDAIYSTLLKRERGELHCRVGEAVEVLYHDHLDQQVELLARHYSWSVRKDKALHYLILAGQKNAREYANDQARHHFDQALNLLPEASHSVEQTLQVFSGLADVLGFVGEYGKSQAYYREALNSISTDVADRFTSTRSMLLRKLGTTHERQGDYANALKYFSDAQDLLETSPIAMPAQKAQIINDIGWTFFRMGNMESAESNLRQALSLALDSGRYDVIASVYNRLGGIYYQKDQLDQASQYVQKSLDIREKIGDMVAVARTCNNLGLLDWKRSRWDSALAYLRRSFELNANFGDIEGVIELHSNMGLIQLDCGNMDEARHHLEESLNKAVQIGHSFLEGLAYMHLGRFWLLADDWEKSLDYGRRSLKVFEELKSSENLVDLLVAMGEAYLGSGDICQADALAERAKACLEEQSKGQPAPDIELGRLLRLRASIYRLKGDLNQAESYLNQALTHFRAAGNELEQGRTYVALASMAESRGDPHSAGASSSTALEIFTRIGAQLDLAKLNPQA